MEVPGGAATRRITVCAFLAAFGVVVSGPASGQDRAPRAGAPDSVRASGVVLDRTTGRELSGVVIRIEAVDSERPVDWMVQTGSSGRFRSPNLPQGVYVVSVEAMGFSTIRDQVVLSGASEVDFRIELVPDALELEPIVVTSLRRTRLEASGFEQRRRLGLGHTFTREEIELRSPTLVSDLFRMVPGTEVSMTRGRGRAVVRLRRGCVPDLVVNGVLVRNPGPIDDILSVGDLEALEVHHGGAGSLTLSSNTCGAIMAWTREGGGQGGEMGRLDRLVAALAVVAFGFFLTR